MNEATSTTTIIGSLVSNGDGNESGEKAIALD